MNAFKTGTAYKVERIEDHKQKEVHSKRTQEELDVMADKDFALLTDNINTLNDKISSARIKKDYDAVTYYARKLRNIQGIKRRDLNRFKVTFFRGHSNIFDEATMQKQNLRMVAPRMLEGSDEIINDSKLEHYIGLMKGEFIRSNVKPPIFDGDI